MSFKIVDKVVDIKLKISRVRYLESKFLCQHNW